MNKLSTLKNFAFALIFITFNQVFSQVPSAKFGPNKLIYVEQYGSTQLFDSSTNNPTQWEWYIFDSITYKSQGFYPNLSSGEIYSDPWGNGNDEFSKNPEFAFDVPGTYSVKMRCKNSTGWSNWVIKKNCIKVQLPTLYNLGYGTYGANNDNIVDSDTGTISDDGGINLNYGNNQGINTRSYLYIQPCKAKKITLIMQKLKFADNGDILNVYDGDFVGQNNLLASWTKNNTSNKTVVANSGKMLIIFTSNSSGVDSGFYGTYSVIKDTSIASASYNFDVDSPYYNSTPARFYSKVVNKIGSPTYEWTVNGNQVSNNSKSNFNYTFTSDGKYNVCMYGKACDEVKKICKDIYVVTANSKTTINFKSKSYARYAYDSVFLIPETSNANRFEWFITPTSYQLLNPPASPSSVKSGEIKINALPGDTLYVPRISFLDTVCYTIKLKAYNSLNPSTTIDSLTKSNYICATDFRQVYGIFGTVYNDINNNCQISSSEPYLNNVPIKLYDSNNKLIAYTQTFGNGIYRFDKTVGTYSIKIDVAGSNILTKCPTGDDSTITISNQNKSNGVNFGVSCSQYEDIGVASIRRSGWVFPGRSHELTVGTGDLINKFTGINCSNGTGQSGTVKIELAGKANIISANVTPSSTSNKVYTFNVSNFNNVNLYETFKLTIKVDTNASASDSLTVQVKVTNSGSDIDTNNNKFTFKYRVINSYDPNEKDVSPMNVSPLFNDWLTYTIHFQNTGSAPAFNIRLADTLDQNLDLETFTVLNASHEKRVSLKGRALNIYFDDIMLPDSFTDKEGSKGFFQYKIKPIDGLGKGIQIKNTAYIYFDYNAPVVTNTTINEYVEKENSIINIYNSDISIYPNPSAGIFKFEMSKGEIQKVEIFNSVGTKIISNQIDTNKEVNLSQYPEGIYLAKIYTSKGVYYTKLIRI